jgi:hypothetical protein
MDLNLKITLNQKFEIQIMFLTFEITVFRLKYQVSNYNIFFKKSKLKY